MKKIQLTQDKIALVDDDMYEELSQHKWYAYKEKNTFYAKRHIIKNHNKTITMHCQVIGKPLEGFVNDHRDGNGLNNQRNNLRFVTCRQNQQNQQNVNSSSQYPGVHWHKLANKWCVQIKIKGKGKYLGLFVSEIDAFLTYKKAVNILGQTVIDYD